MVLSDLAKSGLDGAWIDGYDSQNKDKNITITKNKSHLISHLKYFTTLQNKNNMPFEFSKYNRKLSENSY